MPLPYTAMTRATATASLSPSEQGATVATSFASTSASRNSTRAPARRIQWRARPVARAKWIWRRPPAVVIPPLSQSKKARWRTSSGQEGGSGRGNEGRSSGARSLLPPVVVAVHTAADPGPIRVGYGLFYFINRGGHQTHLGKSLIYRDLKPEAVVMPVSKNCFCLPRKKLCSSVGRVIDVVQNCTYFGTRVVSILHAP